MPVCYLEARFANGSRPLMDVLSGGSSSSAGRSQLLEAIGGLVLRLHEAGIHWRRAHPRSVQISRQGDVEFCDFSKAVRFPRSLEGSVVAGVDLHDLLFPSTYRFRAADRLRVLRGYCGDRESARRMLLRLTQRSRMRNGVLRSVGGAFRRVLAATEALFTRRVEGGP